MDRRLQLGSHGHLLMLIYRVSSPLLEHILISDSLIRVAVYMNPCLLLSAAIEEQDKVIITPASEVKPGHRYPNLKHARLARSAAVVEELLGQAQATRKRKENVPDWLALHLREILGQSLLLVEER